MLGCTWMAWSCWGTVPPKNTVKVLVRFLFGKTSLDHPIVKILSYISSSIFNNAANIRFSPGIVLYSMLQNTAPFSILTKQP